MAYKFVFLGAPGSGKGTWSATASQSLDLTHLSTGDLLRQEVASGSELGQEAASYMEAGALVPDEIILALVEKKLDKIDSFILDGFPRTIAQAKALDEILDKKGQELSKVIYLDVPEEELYRRITNRVVCPNCSATYNTISMPPKEEGICDVCGSKLVQRHDDTAEVLKKRLDTYHKQTAPLLDYYKDKKILHRFENYGANIEEQTKKFLELLKK